MNPPLTPATRSSDLPAGLTVDEAVRIADAITAAHSDSTRTMYAWAWSQWDCWCIGRRVNPLPADPAMICAYLTERAANGLSVGTIDLACGVISYRHRMHGLDDPILTEGVRQVCRGLAASSAPHPAAKPGRWGPTTSARSLPPSTAPPLRAPATPRSSCSASPPPCDAPNSSLSRSPTSSSNLAASCYYPPLQDRPVREGQVVAVVHGQRAATDPIAALDARLTFRGSASGPLFTSMRNKTVTLNPISREAVSIVLRKRAEAAGLASIFRVVVAEFGA